MKLTTKSLTEILHSTAIAEESPRLLSREEILDILREAEGKKAVPLFFLPKPALLPRILKFSAAALSAAAVLTLFIWKTGGDETAKPPTDIYSETSKQQENAPHLSMPQQRVETAEQSSQQPTQHQQVAQANAPIRDKRMQSATASERASAPQALMLMDENSANERAGKVEKESQFPTDFTSKTVAIVTPERIEPILGKRLNDPETALGISFETPLSATTSRSADIPAPNSWNRSLVPETNSLPPKSSSLVESKRGGGYNPPASERKNSDKSLLDVLRDATANPQIITLIQNGKVVANEWNFVATTPVNTDDLIPVYVSLRGKDIAVGKADYALLWLPPASSKDVQNTINLVVNPNPVGGNSTRLTLTIPQEMTVSIAIYDIFGKKIQDIAQSESIGRWQFSREISLDNFEDGVYIVKVVSVGNKELTSGRFVVERVREK